MGSRVGVRIDKARYLHLYIDGEDQGVVVPDVRQPCWAVFDLVRCNKVCESSTIFNRLFYSYFPVFQCLTNFLNNCLLFNLPSVLFVYQSP